MSSTPTSLQEDEEDSLITNTDARVEETLLNLQQEETVNIESSDIDTAETTTINKFLTDGCGCKMNCHSKVKREKIERRRGNCAELSKQELDLVILGQLAAFEMGGESHRARSTFYFGGVKVCRTTFLLTHGIGEKRFKNLKKHFTAMGLSPRWHGNLGRVPHHAVTLDDTKHAVTFLFEYAEMNALLLPGRVPGYKRTDLQVRKKISFLGYGYFNKHASVPQLLPSSTTKRNVWRVYQEACEKSGKRVLAYTTFARLWRKQVPNILVMKPMSDLCWFCQQNTNLFLRSANQPEEVKSAALKEAEEHLRVVGVERSFYKTTCDVCKQY